VGRIPAERFEEILRLVWRHLTAANTHLTIWEELRSTPEREKLCDTYNGFFAWTRDAHIDRFINKTCVVTDPDKSQPSIYKLANMIQSHPILAPGFEFKNVPNRLKNHEGIEKEIRDVRNIRSDHWDLKKIAPEPNVANCRGLLDELIGLLEDIWNAHEPNPTGGRNIYSVTPEGDRDTSYILDKLTTKIDGCSDG